MSSAAMSTASYKTSKVKNLSCCLNNRTLSSEQSNHSLRTLSEQDEDELSPSPSPKKWRLNLHKGNSFISNGLDSPGSTGKAFKLKEVQPVIKDDFDYESPVKAQRTIHFNADN